MANNVPIGANCMTEHAKELLIEAVGNKREDDIQLDMLLSILENLPDCFDINEPALVPGSKLVDGKLIEIEEQPKQKRKPSAYNIHIGTCMKQEGKNMAQCASEYKK